MPPVAAIAVLGDRVVQPPPPARAAAITTVEYDSRRVRPGAAFVAVRGEKADGLDFVPQALAAGAVLVVSEQSATAGVAGPWIQVRDARLALALLGAEVAGHPSREIPVVGVTGTNGKTTTAFLLAAENGFITGQTIFVCGGTSISGTGGQ